jgi:hypothetical protein
MISYESPKLWQRTWFLALVLGTGVGAGVWWWQTHMAASQAAPEAAASPVAAASKAKAAAKVEVALLVPPTVLEDGRPSDFTPEDWAALKVAMSKTANPRGELERIVKYLRFQKGFEQWQSLQDAPDVATRHQLARRLIEQVPDRMRQGELTMGEALLLESALWADLEPNDDIRMKKLEEAQALLASVAPQADGEQQAREASQQAEYKRREAAILADYQAKPESQRNHAQLEKALEAARQSAYSSKN